MDRRIMPSRSLRLPLGATLLVALAAACSSSAAPRPTPTVAARVEAEGGAGARPVAVVEEGLAGPEAVRYDPEQDVYFVANWNGSPNETSDDGFISRLRPDGTVEQLRFIDGASPDLTLHAPRGMYIVGDTLWAADVDAVRGFDRRTGAFLAEVSFAGMDPGFLNDIATGPDGALYVTDTRRDRIYRVQGGRAEVALADSALDSPNGITWDAANDRFIVVPIGGSNDILAWRPGTDSLLVVGTGPGGRYDGVEVLDGGRILVASQADTSLHLFTRGRGRAVVRTGGLPADIGVDTRRNRVAVPFIALNRVEIWAIP